MCNPLHVHKHEHISSTGLDSDFWIITWGKECFDRPALPIPPRPLLSVNNAYGNHAGPGDVKLPGLALNWELRRRQEMNRCYMAREQDANSTPACDGCCRVGFLFFLRMWNIHITSSTGCRGATLWCCCHHRLRDVFRPKLPLRAKTLTFNAISKEVVIFHLFLPVDKNKRDIPKQDRQCLSSNPWGWFRQTLAKVCGG